MTCQVQRNDMHAGSWREERDGEGEEDGLVSFTVAELEQ